MAWKAVRGEQFLIISAVQQHTTQQVLTKQELAKKQVLTYVPHSTFEQQDLSRVEHTPITASNLPTQVKVPTCSS